MKKKKIYYWAPFISPIATSKAVVNSAESINRFSNKYESYILNFFGEFKKLDKEIKEKKIKLVNYYKFNVVKFLPNLGKFNSRFSFIVMFFLGFFPLKKVLKFDRPDYIIIHLITSLPLVLLIFFNFKTKFILRISGYPRMNFFRKLLWKIAFKKIYLITCPTNNTLNYIKQLNLVDESKLKLLYDPIIEISKINKKKNKVIGYKNYFLSVGRLTKQNNFTFLCQAFKNLIKIDKNIKLLIAGNGEEKNKLKDFINKNNLSQNIILLGYIENIYPYFKNSSGFILTSLWEDPGFVLVEAAHCRVPVMSSDAWPGPSELIKHGYNGVLFKSGNMQSFLKEFEYFKTVEKSSYLKLNNLKMSKKFTIFNHYNKITTLLN